MLMRKLEFKIFVYKNLSVQVERNEEYQNKYVHNFII